jgi:hypothetical protein
VKHEFVTGPIPLRHTRALFFVSRVTLGRPHLDTAEIASVEATMPHAAGRTMRFAGLDVFRFVAVLSMVQGHTFTVVFDPGASAPAWFRWHSYVHGYTAPMFLFASGLAFGITTFPRFHEHGLAALSSAASRPWRSQPVRRLGRYLSLVAIGYLLQSPGHTLTQLDAAAPDAPSIWRVDALHAIGVTLAFAQLLALGLRTPRSFAIASAILAALAVGLAPVLAVAPIDPSVPDAIASYFTFERGSIFPLTPFAGYVFAGIVTAYAMGANDRSPITAAPGVIAAGALLVIGAVLAYRASRALELPPVIAGGHAVFWQAGPLLFVFRAGILLVVLGLVSTLVGSTRPPPVVKAAAQETLVIYVLHLLVLYGSPIHRGLEHDVGETLDLSGAIALAALLVTAMLAVAYVWHWVKTNKPALHDVVRMAIVAIVVVHSVVPR